MRRIFKQIIPIFLAMLFLTSCDNKQVVQYSFLTPEDTVNSMLSAVANKDVETILHIVTDEYLIQNWKTKDRGVVRSHIEEAFKKAAFPPRRPEAYEVINKIVENELVRIEYSLKETHQEKNKPYKAIGAYLLKQVANEWKIYGLDTNLDGTHWINTKPSNPFELNDIPNAS